MSISLLLLTFVVVSVTDFPSCFAADQQYDECKSPLTCGSKPSSLFPNITYPFWGNNINKPNFCGQTNFELSCQNNQTLTIQIENRTLRIVSANLTNQTIIVADDSLSLSENRCPNIFNFNGDERFTLNPTTETIDLYNCSDYGTPRSLSDFTCRGRQEGNIVTYYVFSPNVSVPGCFKSGEVPMLRSVKEAIHNSSLNLGAALEKGFELRYTTQDKLCRDCSRSGGICGSESGSGNFRCLCTDKPHNSSCNVNDDQGYRESDGVNLFLGMTYVEILKRGFVLNWNAHSCHRCNNSGGRCGTNDFNEFVCLCPDGPKIHDTCRNGVSAGVVGVLAASIAWFVYHRKKTKSYRTSSALLPRNISSHPSSKSSGIEKAEELLVGVRLFSYEELEEATNNFDPSKELGDGGFGAVFYGKLKDGRSVAVKRLYDNNFKRAEQFRNEVEILTGLRHPNLVALFGCSSKQSRDFLLVYEYVANGTLADHLHGPQANPSSLPWFTRLKIAVETASALKYLHASKIIHRDVKTNNILLDQNFNVKVADFGLSRLFPMGQTHVSTAPQGTPGYVDPDYHLCYQLSNKSDVYSFAVVLIELISSLPAVDITRPRHEINLSNMAVAKIQNHELQDIVDKSLGFDSDARVQQTVVAVAELAFQCLQSDKDLRPCMSHVLDTLTRIQNNGFGSEVDVVDEEEEKSVELAKESPNSVIVKWDSK
ncbi:unnamed protein product [Cochlearia groenlandica]